MKIYYPYIKISLVLTLFILCCLPIRAQLSVSHTDSTEKYRCNGAIIINGETDDAPYTITVTSEENSYEQSRMDIKGGTPAVFEDLCFGTYRIVAKNRFGNDQALKEVVIKNLGGYYNFGITADKIDGDAGKLVSNFSTEGVVPTGTKKWTVQPDWGYEYVKSGASSNFPTINFFSPGTYSVGLEITPHDGGSPYSARNKIEILAKSDFPINVRMEVYPGAGNFYVNSEVKFKGWAFICGLTEFTWSLDGPGKDSTKKYDGSEHTEYFSQPGDYKVHLKVKNDCGGEDTITETITIKEEDGEVGSEFIVEGNLANYPTYFTTYVDREDNSKIKEIWYFPKADSKSKIVISHREWDNVKGQWFFSTYYNYQSPGTYKVVQRIITNSGHHFEADHVLEITEPNDYQPDFSVSHPNGQEIFRDMDANDEYLLGLTQYKTPIGGVSNSNTVYLYKKAITGGYSIKRTFHFGNFEPLAVKFADENKSFAVEYQDRNTFKRVFSRYARSDNDSNWDTYNVTKLEVPGLSRNFVWDYNNNRLVIVDHDNEKMWIYLFHHNRYILEKELKIEVIDRLESKNGPHFVAMGDFVIFYTVNNLLRSAHLKPDGWKLTSFLSDQVTAEYRKLLNTNNDISGNTLVRNLDFYKNKLIVGLYLKDRDLTVPVLITHQGSSVGGYYERKKFTNWREHDYLDFSVDNRHFLVLDRLQTSFFKYDFMKGEDKPILVNQYPALSISAKWVKGKVTGGMTYLLDNVGNIWSYDGRLPICHSEFKEDNKTYKEYNVVAASIELGGNNFTLDNSDSNNNVISLKATNVFLKNGFTITKGSQVTILAQNCEDLSGQDYNKNSNIFQNTEQLMALSTGDSTKSDSIMIYPNPVKNRLYIQSPEVIQSIQIFDFSGRILYIKFDVQKSEYLIEDINYPSGVYGIKITVSNSMEYVKKIIIDGN
ncbi:Por secretion system C-terminal sorting domain-containing protein [Arenibacter palladensis]|uniref:Por secretion system C-terminal sorting domain-containing protein n=1 Tax=Arenibacter palladensis TaxID=237373 RepID=A0A1M4Y1N2_9FLAO|nr:T9SS type A sorting domain-containing protein [Arenibacter palladensis]SHE99392.1 Por secretion system C-terminal sorting domain-containing protein [Arenibacter palladensis]